MIKNYFNTALRSLWKNKANSFINLFRLSVGMTAAVFIFLFLENELTPNKYHAIHEDILTMIFWKAMLHHLHRILSVLF